MKRRTIFAAGLVAALMGAAATPAFSAGPDGAWGGRGQGARQMIGDCDGPHGAAMGQRGWNNMRGHHGGAYGGGYGPGMMNDRQGGPQGNFGPGFMRGPGNDQRGYGPGMMGDLGAYDSNDDGFLSLDEFEAFHAEVGRPMMERQFRYLDSDGDGRVAISELPAPGSRSPNN
ncbi:EF-hand domain-containing protein [Martelella mangrovi]|uniref:EF-hand domain-containing protein n=1 Tax=Martelella mangrovi TaxID=1397477 RepID=A0ABV2IC60_9HYPH